MATGGKRETSFTRLDIALLCIVALIWFAVMGRLLQRETLLFSQAATPQAQALLKAGERLSYRRMGVYDDKKRIGFTETRITPAKGGGISIATKTEAELALLYKMPVPLSCDSEILLDAQGMPLSLSATLTAFKRKEMGVEISGERRGPSMEIEVKRNDEVIFSSSFPVSDGGGIESGLLPIGDMPGLKEGQSWPLRYVNPITRRVENGRAQVTGLERVSWGRTEEETFRVELTFQDNAYLHPVANIARDGRLIQISGIGGYRFLREEEKP